MEEKLSQEEIDALLNSVANDTASPASMSSTREVVVRPVEFEEFKGDEGTPGRNGNLDLILDVPLQLTVELGRARRQVREILSLGPGSVVELNKLAGENVDVLVNGKLIARGEVVVIDENFGVRVTEIISRTERVKNLG